MRANMDIRNAAKKAGVRLWEIAAGFGINDGNFSRKLRKELPPQERDRIMAIIDDLAQKKVEVS